MVTPRKFTATEWRDLARGCRALVKLDEDAIERHKASTVAGQFEETRQLHLEMVELCEHWALQAERADRAERARPSASTRTAWPPFG